MCCIAGICSNTCMSALSAAQMTVQHFCSVQDFFHQQRSQIWLKKQRLQVSGDGSSIRIGQALGWLGSQAQRKHLSSVRSERKGLQKSEAARHMCRCSMPHAQHSWVTDACTLEPCWACRACTFSQMPPCTQPHHNQSIIFNVLGANRGPTDSQSKHEQ